MWDCFNLLQDKLLVHQRQIQQTTWLAPGRKCMKARLVRLGCFVLKVLLQKSVTLSSIWCILFPLPNVFLCSWMSERVKSSTPEKVFFFSIYPFTSEEKPKRQRLGVHDHQRNYLSSGWKILENVYVIALSSNSCSFGSMLSLISMAGQVHSLAGF